MGSVDGLRFRFFLFVGVTMAAESQERRIPIFLTKN
jgi:hypothetical protein